MLRRFAVAAVELSVAACSSIGPATVVRDRTDYGSSIGNSWKEQTLLNIVKLRYADMPIFLEVAQVIVGYQLQSAISGSFTGGNFNAAAPSLPGSMRSGSRCLSFLPPRSHTIVDRELSPPTPRSPSLR